MEGGAIAQFLPLILIFAIMYFLLIRPQQKKVKEHRAMVEALRKGDRVVVIISSHFKGSLGILYKGESRPRWGKAHEILWERHELEQEGYVEIKVQD